MLFLAALEITVSTDELCCTCKLSLDMIIKILAFSQEKIFVKAQVDKISKSAASLLFRQ